MKSRLATLIAALAVVFVANLSLFAQSGSISGTVVDANGAVVPNATVEVKGQSGQDYKVSTNDSGNFRVPGVAVGTYTITVTNAGFKKSVINNVKVDIGTPATADVVLEAGNVSEVVEVTSGGEVLQTQTATVGTNITGRQINQTPIASRDALDLILRLPGVASVGAPRQSSINGLPKGAIQLSIDGVDVQDNFLRSSDGFFTFVRPRVDAIEEVIVSTASPGAESTGDGAVQVRFATKRGTNDYRGTVYWQNRNTALNAAYWYNNRDFITNGVNKIDGKANRDVSKLNQPGFAVGGPIPYPHFGEGGPKIMSGKDKMFFFVNYEEFRLPGSQNRQRTVLRPEVRNGLYRYISTISSGPVPSNCTLISGTSYRCEANLFTIAQNAGQVSTIDPTVNGVLGDIAATLGNGSLSDITSGGAISDYNRQLFSFSSNGAATRKFFVLRLDGNVTKNHSVEFVMNRQNFLPSIDFINNQDAPFPGGNSYGQGGVRKSWTWAVRSTLSSNVVNEARYAVSGGGTEFAQGCCADDFSSQGGRNLGIGGGLGITSLRAISGTSFRRTPTYDWTDNVTLNAGNHTFAFGGQYKRVVSLAGSQTCCPTVGFGTSETLDSAVYNMFNTTTMPGASPGQLTEARAFYSTLTGRVSSYGQTAVLDAAGNYVPSGSQEKLLEQKTYGLYVQDSWRIHPSLSVTLGLRWQPRMGVTAESANWSTLSDPNMIYGNSGEKDSIFRPGPLVNPTRPITTIGYAIGDKISPDDLNNFAPSVGVVWSPNFGTKGILRRAFGESGKSVFRAGWSRSFVREGLGVPDSLIAANPGGSINVGRSEALTGSGFTYGSLLRTPGNTNLTPNQSVFVPSYPLAVAATDQPGVYDANTTTGYVDSFNVGYQRELDRNTVVEIRYVGNRGIKLERQRNINERNMVENGIFSEFRLAQQNLYANVAANGGAGRCQGALTPATSPGCQYNFAYFGPGTGTNPLPISLAYFNGTAATLSAGALNQYGSVTSALALNAALYTSANFRSTTYTTSMNMVAANANTWATALASTAAQRANAVAAGLPANFQQVNHLQLGGTWIIDNTGTTWYDSAVIELRRRLSAGLRVQGSYTFSKAQTDMFAVSSAIASTLTNRDFGQDLNKTVQPFDLRHNFKVDATYDLPFGRGRAFFSNSGRLVDTLVGGWTILPVLNWQSGSPIQIGNAQLVGMTVKELQKAVKVRKEGTAVYWLPDDIIQNSIRAFNTNVLIPGGYATTGTFNGAPTGRYIAPAGFGNCLADVPGKCGFNNIVFYGPTYFKVDFGITKRFTITERMNIELRTNMLDVLNHPNFRVGGWAANVTTSGCCGATFGQLASGSAYRDNNTTNDPGGRVIDLQLRFNF